MSTMGNSEMKCTILVKKEQKRNLEMKCERKIQT